MRNEEALNMKRRGVESVDSFGEKIARSGLFGRLLNKSWLKKETMRAPEDIREKEHT